MPCSGSENIYTMLDLFPFYSSLRLWAVSGEVLMEMVGHTAIVYSVDSHASGLIVSGSEDRFAKIWKGDDLFLASCYRDHASFEYYLQLSFANSAATVTIHSFMINILGYVNIYCKLQLHCILNLGIS
jgi:WD40 repeat protein